MAVCVLEAPAIRQLCAGLSLLVEFFSERLYRGALYKLAGLSREKSSVEEKSIDSSLLHVVCF